MRKWDSERLNKLHKVAELVSSRAKIRESGRDIILSHQKMIINFVEVS